MLFRTALPAAALFALAVGQEATTTATDSGIDFGSGPASFGCFEGTVVYQGSTVTPDCSTSNEATSTTQSTTMKTQGSSNPSVSNAGIIDGSSTLGGAGATSTVSSTGGGAKATGYAAMALGGIALALV